MSEGFAGSTCLIIVLATSAVGGRVLARTLLALPSGVEMRALAWGVCSMGWALTCVQGLALAADLTERPLVRMPLAAIVSSFALAVALFLGRWGGSIREEPAAEQEAGLPPRGWRRKLRWVCFVPVAILHLGLLIAALTDPPTGYDSLYYHLPIVIRWLRAGRLYMIPYVHQFSLPGNGNVWQLLFAATRFEPLVTIAFVPAGLLLATAVAAIAREIGGTRTAAWTAAFFTLASPMVALQMYSSYVDVFGSAFLVSALFWLLRLAKMERGARGGSAGIAVLCGWSAGIAVGSKPNLAIWALAIVVGAAAILLRNSRRARRTISRRGAFACAGAFALASIVGCGFWFFRAQRETGWVLHPVQLSFAGATIGTGKPLGLYANHLTRARWTYLFVPWFEWKQAGEHYSVDSGLGPHFASFAVVGMVATAARLATARRRRRRRRPALWLIAGFCGFGLLLFFSIFRSYVRFALPLALIGLAASASLVDLLLRTRRRSAAALIVTTLVLSAAMVGWSGLEASARRWARGTTGRTAFYFLPPPIEEQPRDTVVLNLGEDTMNYPLLGKRWGNRVIESMLARRLGLVAPLTQTQLDDYGVDLVYTEGEGPAPFEGAVRFETLCDAASDGTRELATRRIRLYRISHVEHSVHVGRLFGPGTTALEPPFP